MGMDGHGVLGMIAPRAFAIATGSQDSEGDGIYAGEMNIKEAATVYSLLGASHNLSLLPRQGDHHGYVSLTAYFDYFDRALGRRVRAAAAAPPPPMPPLVTPAGFSLAEWIASSGASRADAPPPNAPLPRRVAWLLDSNATTQLPTSFGIPDSYCEESISAPDEWARLLMGHEGGTITQHGANITSTPFGFGTYVTGTAFYDATAIARRAWPSGAAPAVVWLHGYNYNRGYDTHGNNSAAFLDLVVRGYVVVCYDMVGFGMRVREGGSGFYQRYAHGASLLGKMVADATAVIDALYCFSPQGRDDAKCFHAGSNPSPKRLESIPAVDYGKVLLAGYAVGGAVALHAAALDSRVAGVASIAGFTPMRTDVATRPTGGLRRLAEMHALAPRLGLFLGDEAALPYDYGDLLDAVAPRPTLLYTPMHDRDATFADVAACVDAARAAWAKHGAEGRLSNPRPDDYTRISPGAVTALLAWADAATAANA